MSIFVVYRLTQDNNAVISIILIINWTAFSGLLVYGYIKGYHNRHTTKFDDYLNEIENTMRSIAIMLLNNMNVNIHLDDVKESFVQQCLLVFSWMNKGNNKITELRTIFQRESQNSQVYKQTKSVNNRKTVKTVMTLTWYRHF